MIRLLLLLLFSMNLAAVQVEKGAEADARLTAQGFEDDTWELTWTVVDADDSGQSWVRHFESDYYGAHGGDSSLGCRYNADGSANDDWLISPALSDTSGLSDFAFYYRSQDPLYPESMEVLLFSTNEVQTREQLASRLDDFQLLDRFDNVPVDWQLYRHQPDFGAQFYHYYALRCVSEDSFVLLIDDAQGGMLLTPVESWALGPGSEQFQFGMSHADSLGEFLNLQNLDPVLDLVVTLEYVPDWPFEVFSELEFALAGDQEADILLTAVLYDAAGSDTTWFDGFHEDSLRFWLKHVDLSDTNAVAEDSTLVSVGLQVAFWRSESTEDLVHYQGFEADSLDEGWETWAEECGTDPLGWELAEQVSSANFTIPATSQFSYINSDERGLQDEQGEALVQCAFLGSPWFPGRDGDQELSYLLGWDQVYNGQAGGNLDLLMEYADGSREFVTQLDENSAWESHSRSLRPGVITDSLRFLWRFTGSWSYGAAIDEVVLIDIPGNLAIEDYGVPQERPRHVELSFAPNPFNPVTTLRFSAPSPGTIRSKIYNLRGQLVLDTGTVGVKQGSYTQGLDFSPYASGVYLIEVAFRDASGHETRLLDKVSYLR